MFVIFNPAQYVIFKTIICHHFEFLCLKILQTAPSESLDNINEISDYNEYRVVKRKRGRPRKTEQNRISQSKDRRKPYYQGVKMKRQEGKIFAHNLQFNSICVLHRSK